VDFARILGFGIFTIFTRVGLAGLFRKGKRKNQYQEIEELKGS
jgi:hypothetical protein